LLSQQLESDAVFEQQTRELHERIAELEDERDQERQLYQEATRKLVRSRRLRRRQAKKFEMLRIENAGYKAQVEYLSPQTPCPYCGWSVPGSQAPLDYSVAPPCRGLAPRKSVPRKSVSVHFFPQKMN